MVVLGSSRMAQMSKMSFLSPVALDLPICQNMARMPQMGAQGGLGQQSDGPDEQNEFPRWSWAAVGLAQVRELTFRQQWRSIWRFAQKVAMMQQMGVQSCLGQQKEGPNKKNQLFVSSGARCPECRALAQLSGNQRNSARLQRAPERYGQKKYQNLRAYD